MNIRCKINYNCAAEPLDIVRPWRSMADCINHYKTKIERDGGYMSESLITAKKVEFTAKQIVGDWLWEGIIEVVE